MTKERIKSTTQTLRPTVKDFQIKGTLDELLRRRLQIESIIAGNVKIPICMEIKIGDENSLGPPKKLWQIRFKANVFL